jgi:MFS family permease
VLAVAPGRYDAVFVVSLCAAVIGLGVLTGYLPAPAAPASGTGPTAVSLRATAALLRMPGMRAVLVAATLLGLATLGDAFVYLALQDRLGFDVGLFPLLPVATSLVFMLAAVPVGLLADRAGRGRVFVAGYLALLAVYGVLLGPAGAASAVAALVFLGVYYAATDGVLMALAGEAVPVAMRGTGLAVVATATSLSRLTSSLLFGLVWTVAGVHEALVGFTVGLLAAVVVAVILLGRVGRETLDDHDTP